MDTSPHKTLLNHLRFSLKHLSTVIKIEHKSVDSEDESDPLSTPIYTL